MDDLEFVRLCAKGDKQSWDQFLKQYSRLIYSYIYSVLRKKGLTLQEETVDDLFQDIVLSLIKDDFRKLRSFQGKNGCTLASWLRAVTVNFTLSYSRNRDPELSLEEEMRNGFSLASAIPDESADSSQIAIDSEEAGILKECFDTLTENDRYFVELHFNRMVKLEELKDHFRVSRGAIDMQKSRVIQRLKECFKSKGFALDL